MPSAYDDLMPPVTGAVALPAAQKRSAFDDLYPPAPQNMEIGHALPRWDTRRTGGPPSISGAMEAFGKSLQGAVGDWDRGARQLFNYLPFGSPEDRQKIAEELAAEQQASTAERQQPTAEHPIASGLGGAAPYALMPQRALPAMLGGALWEGMKYGSPGERASAAVGGGVNSLIGNVLGNIGKFSIQPAPNNANTLGLQGAAARLGAPLTAGQRSADARTLGFEDYLRQTPFGSIPLQRVGNEQAVAVNRAAAKSIGENADSLTSDVLQLAKGRISGYYDDITARTQLLPHKELADDIKAFRDALQTDTEPGIRAVMEKQLDKYTKQLLTTGWQNRKVTGDAFQSLQSQLKEMRDAGGEKGMWAGKLVDIFKRGIERNISPEDKALWDLANQQYRNYKRITDKAFAVNSVTGQVNPKAVARQLESEGDRFARGQLTGPMADIGYFGRGMPSTAIGSQTAPRYFWNEMRNNPVGGVLGGIPDYIAASILARGGLFTGQPWLQGPASATLGYLGRAGGPGLVQGLFNQ